MRLTLIGNLRGPAITGIAIKAGRGEIHLGMPNRTIHHLAKGHYLIDSSHHAIFSANLRSLNGARISAWRLFEYRRWR